MMSVTRDNLRRKNYAWPNHRRPSMTQSTGGRFLRNAGEHVVAVLQRAADALRLQTPEDLHLLEDMLHNELPSSVTTVDDVFLWLYVEFKRRALLR